MLIRHWEISIRMMIDSFGAGILACRPGILGLEVTERHWLLFNDKKSLFFIDLDCDSTLQANCERRGLMGSRCAGSDPQDLQSLPVSGGLLGGHKWYLLRVLTLPGL